jgi:hypothetical protein
MAEPRTKQTAMDTLEAMRKEIVKTLEDSEIAALLTPELLKSVFGESWRLQHEDNPTQFSQAVRDLVVDAASRQESGEKR